MLSTATVIGVQNTVAQEKATLIKPFEKKANEKPTKSIEIPKKEIILEELFKKVEDLKPNTKERQDILESLKKIAIANAKSPDRAKISLKLIDIMDKTRTTENWSEIAPIAIDIITQQAIENKKTLGKNEFDVIIGLELDQKQFEPLSKLLLSVFDKDTGKDLKELQKEAINHILSLSTCPAVSVEPFLSLNNMKLKALTELKENRLKEVGEGLKELQQIYSKMSEYYKWNKLTESSTPYLEKILISNINSLFNDDIKIQAIAANNLAILNDQFSFNTFRVSQVKDLLDAKKYSKSFFDKKLYFNENTNVKEVEVIASAGLTLLSLASDSDYSNKLMSWLNSHAENSIKSQSLEKQKRLEAILRNAITTVPRTTQINKESEQFKALIPAYTKLIKHNNSDHLFLSNGLNGLKEIIELHFGSDSLKAETVKYFHHHAVDLFNTILDGIDKLPQEKAKLLRLDLLKAQRAFYFYINDDELQDDFINRLSTFYCKNQKIVNEKEFMKVANSLLRTYKDIDGSVSIETLWTPYMMVNFIGQNPEYFEKNIHHVIETAKVTKNADELIDLYLSFHCLFNTSEIRQWLNSTDVSTSWVLQRMSEKPNLKKQISKTENWFNEKLEKQAFETILSLLENIKDSKGTTDTQQWELFNQRLQRIEKYTPNPSNEIRSNILIQKLQQQQDKTSPLTKMYFATLELALSPEDPILVNFLKDELTKAKSLFTAQGIGKLMPIGTLNNVSIEKQRNFVISLQDRDVRAKLKASDISVFQRFTIDLIQILDGNVDSYKTYLPHCTFKADENGKVNSEDYKVLMKLRKDAFLTLASSASNHSEYLPKEVLQTYRGLIMDLLEQRFEKYDLSEVLPRTWGEQMAALINVYSNTKDTLNESNAYVNSKLGFLKGVLFDGIPKTYDIDGKKKTYITIPLFNRIIEGEFIKLNPAENRKILHDLEKVLRTGEELRESLFKEAPQLQVKYVEMRKQFALAFISATRTYNKLSINECLNDLRQLGFRDYEIRNVAEVLLKE